MTGRAEEPPRAVPRPRGGLMHAVDATTYSLAGARRLWNETAVRLELLGAGVGLVALWLCGAGAGEVAIAVILFLALIATEALNTAIEVLTDRISPEWSIEAKHAKDLGSLAVGLMILCNLGWVGAACLGLI